MPGGLDFNIRYETRLCKVKGELGLFHCWEHWTNVIGASALRGGHTGGQVGQVYGIVEFKDGVRRVEPTSVHFCDETNMHKIAAKEFSQEDFSREHLFGPDDMLKWDERKDIARDNALAAVNVDGNWCYFTPQGYIQMTCNILNHYREKYLETQDKRYWWQMIQLLPSSYNQRRTVMLNYEVLANIYKSRRNHKLDEWHTFCDWIEELPYSELITGPSLKDTPKSFSIKIPKEKVAPEVLNLIERVEREEQQRVKFGHHMSDGSLDPRFVIETEDDCDGKQ